MKILFLLLISISLVSCGSFGDAKKVLKNEKIRNTDEFLVKKKEPLELPPDFSDIPKPDTLKKDVSKNTEDQKLEKCLMQLTKNRKMRKNLALQKIQF